MSKTQKLCRRFLFSISISGDSSSYFLEMIMLIGSVGNMTQTKIIVGKKTYRIRAQCVFLIAKCSILGTLP